MEIRKPWHIPEIWPGSTVYIIGGGPSLEGKDLSSLKKERVIGINQAFRFFPWVPIVYFGDCQFYPDNIDDLKNYRGVLISSCGRIPEKGWPSVHRLARKKWPRHDKDEEPKPPPHGIASDSPDTICWNGNSGASGINIAYWLGARKIILLGFDMCPDEKGKHSYHNEYGKRGKRWNPYGKHLSCFSYIAADAKKLGVEILNGNPNSRIKEFPFTEMK